MKFMLAIVSLCLVTVSADDDLAALVSSLDKIITEVPKIYIEVKDRLKNQINQRFLSRENKIKDALDKFFGLGKTTGACANVQNDKFLNTLDIIHWTMQDCREEDIKRITKILADISAFTERLEKDGKEIKRLYETCYSYSGIIGKLNCINVWKSIVPLYQAAYRKSIAEANQIRYIPDENVSCDYDVIDDSIKSLDHIYTNLKHCN